MLNFTVKMSHITIRSLNWKNLSIPLNTCNKFYISIKCSRINVKITFKIYTHSNIYLINLNKLKLYYLLYITRYFIYPLKTWLVLNWLNEF